jgi:hypothetical protein
MRVQISQQSFFDLLNKADEEGTPYSFCRVRPVNQATAEWHTTLVSDDLGLTVDIERKQPEPCYYLELQHDGS